MTAENSTYRPAHLTAVAMADGRSEATWAPSAEWGNPVGNVHGGYIALLVDDVAGMALMSLIGSGAPTVSLQVDYLNPMPLGRTYTARGSDTRREGNRDRRRARVRRRRPPGRPGHVLLPAAELVAGADGDVTAALIAP